MIVVAGINRDDFEAWKANRITEAVFNAIYKELLEARKNMGDGNYLNAENPYLSHARGYEMSGKCKALESVIEMQVE